MNRGAELRLAPLTILINLENMMHTHVISVYLLIGLVASTAMAEIGGTVKGVVSGPSDAVIVGAKVTITANHGTFVRRTLTDSRGSYLFSGVPLGKFTLRVEAGTFEAAVYRGELVGSAPLSHNFDQVTVSDTDPAVAASLSVTHRVFREEQIERQPMAQPQRAMSAVIETVPGAVSEENGRMHIRGAETQPQFVLDGIPLADNLTGTFATGLDTENVRSAEIVTGNMPAEYGDRVSALVNLTSKSGLEMPLQGAVAVSGGSFSAQALDVEIGGHKKQFGFFLTADGSRNSRFLDPPDLGNFHNAGGIVHTFTRFDWVPTGRDSIRLSLAANGSDFQVPNILEQEVGGQRQRQRVRDDFQSISWDHLFGRATGLGISVSRRSAEGSLLDPYVTGQPYYIEQHRRQRTEGGRARLSHEWLLGQLQAGIEYYRFPVSENFDLGITDPSAVEPEEPLAQYTPQDPFRFRQKLKGWRTAGFVQQHFHFANRLTVDAGLRFDQRDVVISEHGWSPRIGVAYSVRRTGTVFRGAYNRLFQTPPLENLLLSSSREVAALSTERPADSYVPVPSERQNFYEVGIRQRINSHLHLDISRYIKNVRNSSDEAQLLTTAIIFPVSVAGADIRGTELRIDFSRIHGWSGYASYANARATITTPLTGGIFLGTDAESLFVPGSRPADQDERNEAQAGIAYTHPSGVWGSLTARFDSGLPTEFDADDLAETNPRIAEQIDTARMRTKPRTVLNLVGGIDLWRETRHPVAIQIGVNNLFDRLYLYNFHSAFSGTHTGRPREVVGRVVFRFISR